MRAFLTGASGFVGTWLTRHLREMGDDVDGLNPTVDIAGREPLEPLIEQAAPDVVYHLAGYADVAQSWSDPAETYRVNVVGTVRLLHALINCAPSARVILVSSGEVYGRGKGVALTEDAPLFPVTPYAASKVAAEFAGIQSHLGRDLDVVCVRPFNHVGPGQSPAFVISGLAKRVIEAEMHQKKEIPVGNLDSSRDFTDVRDVVRAYRLVAVNGLSGEVYNVSSGRTVEIAAVLGDLLELAQSRARPVEDPTLIRPIDVPLLVGDPSKLIECTGYKPVVPLSETLSDVLKDWRARLASPVEERGVGAGTSNTN